jgi:hypothetical protein
MRASVGPGHDGWVRFAGVFTEFDRYEQRPLRRSAKRASRGVDSLQRDPDSEEVEAPLVEPGVPHRVFVVAVVVDRATAPASARGRKRSAPVGMWRLAGAPGCRSIAPRSSVEVTALVVAVPGAAGPAGAVVTRSAWSVHSGAMIAGSAGSAGSAGAVIAWSARSWTTWAVIAWSARSWTTGAVTTRTARSRASRSWAARPTRTVAAAARILVCRSASRRRGAVAAAGSWARSGAGRTSAHAQRGRPQGAGDGRSGHQLLQFHRRSPVSWSQWTLAPRRLER